MTDYKLVPAEPTPEMLEAMDNAVFKHGNVVDAYFAMLHAAPAAPVVGEPVAWRYRWNDNNHDRPWRWAFTRNDAVNAEMRGYEVRAVYEATDPKLDVAEKAMRDAMDAMTELNMSNYNHDDVDEANNGTIEAWAVLDQALAQIKGGA